MPYWRSAGFQGELPPGRTRYPSGHLSNRRGILQPSPCNPLVNLVNRVGEHLPLAVFLGQRQNFFDLGGAIGAFCMAIVLLANVARNTRALYIEERIVKP